MQHLLERVERLNRIGIALSAEKDPARLLEMILRGAKELTGADGGSLYSVTPNRTLAFDIIATDSLGISMGGTTGRAIPFPQLPLYDEQSRPITNMVVACAVHERNTINIADAYDAAGYDFSGTRKFDSQTGYRTRSLLTIPMKNHEDEIIGVLQLINAQHPETGEITTFSTTDQQLAESLASQAAVALTTQRLISDLQKLFESFIQLIATAIDEKSPYTGSHCRRIPVLTMMLAEAVHNTGHGPLADFRMTQQDRYELETAAWLHDCGKVTSPEYVIDKSTKLETIFDRIELIDTRFEVLKRDAEIDYLKRSAPTSPAEREKLAKEFRDTISKLEEERAFLRKANIGGEFMSPVEQQRVREIGGRQLLNQDGELVPLLTPEEIYNLTIPKGTLTPEERTIVNNHMVATIKMLESLPFPKHLSRVPEYAGGHHERMDGKGYPKGLRREEMSVPARIMAIADVFEALSARDRPYKKGKTISECLVIMRNMAQNNHLDPDLFEIFEREKVYLRYAQEFMHPDQIDSLR
ncbi:MAG TPA: HD domain-containing phosphohydrolase [Gammaproteobacteria bacterium]|nr:HD domain-containing phosphohydrolase [Gammaproteobacteria bacterium]